MEPTSIQSSLLASATEDEIVVSQVLLDLKTLLSLTESLAKFNWGRRRRRSCLEEDPPLLPASSSRPPPIQRLRHEIEEMRLRIGAAEKGGCAASSSPTTPLSFSPSEPDDKSNCRKASKKRPREEYLDVIKGLSQTRDVLRVEVENVKKFYNKLKAYNSELKALKQEMINKFPIKEVVMNRRVNFGADLTRDYWVIMAPHQLPGITDPTAQQQFHFPTGPIQIRDRAGPIGIDLNFPAAEAFELDSPQPLDVGQGMADRRARYAEARRERKGLMRAKSMRSGVSRNCQQNFNYIDGVL